MADIKVISATLLSGHNTVQVTDPMISDGSIFEIYVSDPNIICNNIVVGGTTANITFDSKPTENTSIKVMVNNTSGVLKVPSADVTDGETTQSAINTSVSNSITDINNRLPSDTVLGGVLYHSTTGNVWKKLTGANVDYDQNNTVNEKIDACFQSVSSGKILIADAITDKGVETLATDTFQTMADNIGQITTGGSADHYQLSYYTNSVSQGYQTISFTTTTSGVLKCGGCIYGDYNAELSINGVSKSAVWTYNLTDKYVYNNYFEQNVNVGDTVVFRVRTLSGRFTCSMYAIVFNGE